jgi:hypothetical protein
VQFLRIVALAIVSASVYGIAHDLVTAHVCVEYFTIGHEPVFGTQSPVLLALGWGVLATWWMGLLLGLPLAMSARLGDWPKIGARDLLRPIAVLLLVMGVAAIVAGAVGWQVASAGGVRLLEPLASRVPADRHVPFLADLWAHVASYAVGAVGGLVLCAWTIARRGRAARASGLRPDS